MGHYYYMYHHHRVLLLVLLALASRSAVLGHPLSNEDAAAASAAMQQHMQQQDSQVQVGSSSSSSLPEKDPRSVDLRASTYSSAGLTDLKNGIKTALGAQIGGNFGGFDNGLGNTGGLNAFGTAAGLGGLGAVGAGLALGLAKASKTKGEDEYGVPTYEDFTPHSPHSKVSSPMEDLRARLVDAVPDEGMGRIARFFLLGGQDASDNKYNNNNDQYGNNFGLGNKDTSNLLNLNLNSREIQEQLFRPENIATQVGRNFVEVISTTIGWTIVGALFGQSGNIGFKNGYNQYRDTDTTSYEAPETYGAPSYGGGGSSGGPFANLLSKFSKGSSGGHGQYTSAAAQVRSDDGVDAQNTFEARTINTAVPATLNGANAAGKQMESLSVEQLQKMVELEEQTKAGYFEGMTELEKYKMYKKAQMMLAIKKLKAEEKAVEEMVAEEEAMGQALNTMVSASAANEAPATAATKTVRRRMRKRKPQNQ